MSKKKRIGVCSWSLRADSPAELATRAAACGVSHVQLALEPLRPSRPQPWSLDETADALAAQGIACLSGMMEMEGEDYSTLDSIRRTGGVRPDEHWEANLAAAHENAIAMARLGLDLVSFHAGFLPHEDGAERRKLLARLREMVDVFADAGARTAFETGQESADTLVAFLNELDRDSAGVNFDPANMILYDQGDPIAGLRRLAPRVLQIHVKDATRTKTAGEWGAEVCVGTGDVDWPAFFATLDANALDVDLVIEREAGDRRIDDIIAARGVIEEHIR